jgi:hypothetical protein
LEKIKSEIEGKPGQKLYVAVLGQSLILASVFEAAIGNFIVPSKTLYQFFSLTNNQAA